VVVRFFGLVADLVEEIRRTSHLRANGSSQTPSEPPECGGAERRAA
jgi:hypothetical protein